MAAWLGSYGPAAFGGDDLPQPSAVIMQYTGHSDYTENDPPTFACVGEGDGIANWRIMERRLTAMSTLGIPTWRKDGLMRLLLFGKLKCNR